MALLRRGAIALFEAFLGRASAQTLSAQSAASQSYHIGRTARFIGEDQLFRIKASLAFAPKLARLGHVRALLFAGQNRFF